MTNNEILNFYEGLSKVANNKELRFPVKTSYAMLRNIRALAPIVEDIQTTRDSILKTYGEPVEDKPGYYSIPKENREVAQKELSSLNSVEQDVAILKIALSDLDNIELSVEELNGLYEMLED